MSATSLNPIQLASVSPCSRCTNQLSEPKDGHPSCPRRQMQVRKADLVAKGASTQHLDHLVLTGREAALQNVKNILTPGNNDLRNPVYWNEGGAILIWIATLADNGGIPGANGTLVTPNLLDPTFDRSYIQCHPVPVVPAVPEATYFSNGAFNEGDQLEVRFSANQQVNLQSETHDSVLIDGFAQKVNFAFFVPRAALKKDTVPSGT